MSTDEMIIGIAPDGRRFPVEKLDAHRRNVPHEAISVFVFHDGRLLLQRRAAGKYHSPGLWANTCCSHPRWGEAPADCARRRLREEVGIDMPLMPLGQIRYATPVGELFENEHVHCFAGAAGPATDLSRANPHETDGLTWRSLAEIDAAMANEDLAREDLADEDFASEDGASERLANKGPKWPSIFAPWFAIYLRDHRFLLNNAARLCESSNRK